MRLIEARLRRCNKFGSDHENGLFVKTQDSKSIGEEIKLTINDDVLREKLVKKGYKFAELNTFETHAKEVYHFIENQCT